MNPRTFLVILDATLWLTALYIALILLRRRLVRWACKRHPDRVTLIIAKARLERLISAKDESKLRIEFATLEDQS